MKKLLLGIGVLCMASVAVPAFAQGWGGYSGYGYGRSYGYGGYASEVRQHVRACRQHERFHERLGEEHAGEHDEGFYGRGDHGDAHELLDDAHGEYHDERGGMADNCRYWNRQYHRMLESPSYGRGYRRPPSWSFGFSGY